MQIDYPSIAPLVRSSDQDGTVLQVVFQDASGGPAVQATGTLRRGTGVAGATRATVQRKLLSKLSFAISRAVSDSLGDNVVSRAGLRMARSTVEDAAVKVDQRYSPAEKQKAILEAFRSVADQFRWDGAAWVTTSEPEPSGGSRGAFGDQLDAAPIIEPDDLGLLGRMLVELSCADGEIGEDEREFLGTFLPADMDVDELAAGPKLSVVDLSDASEGPVRETMLMLAWGLAFCDDDLDDAEKAACRRFSMGLGIPRARRKVLREAASEFVLELRDGIA